MSNLMHDIKEGFIQRRLPDGGFKVHFIPKASIFLEKLKRLKIFSSKDDFF